MHSPIVRPVLTNLNPQNESYSTIFHEWIDRSLGFKNLISHAELISRGYCVPEESVCNARYWQDGEGGLTPRSRSHIWSCVPRNGFYSLVDASYAFPHVPGVYCNLFDKIWRWPPGNPISLPVLYWTCWLVLLGLTHDSAAVWDNVVLHWQHPMSTMNMQ